MGYGLTTTTKTKTVTKTSTNTITTSKQKAPHNLKREKLSPKPPIASTSARRLSSQSTDSDSSGDDDPEFGRKAREKVKKEVEEDKARLESKGKGKGKKRKADEVKDEESEEDNKPKRKSSSTRVSTIEAAKKRYDIKSEDEEGSLGGDESGSSDESSKGKAARRSSGGGKKSGGGGYKRAGKAGPEMIQYTKDEIDKHLKSRWRSRWQKRNPEHMSTGRMKMEKLFNPLVDLLEVELIQCNTDEEKGRSIRHVDDTANSDLETSFDESELEDGGLSDSEDEKMKVDNEDSDRKPSRKALAKAIDSRHNSNSSDQDLKPIIPPSRPSRADGDLNGSDSGPDVDTDASSPDIDTDDGDDDDLKPTQLPPQPRSPPLKSIKGKEKEKAEEEEEEEDDDPRMKKWKLDQERKKVKEVLKQEQIEKLKEIQAQQKKKEQEVKRQKDHEEEIRKKKIMAETVARQSQQSQENSMDVDEEEEEDQPSYADDNRRQSLQKFSDKPKVKYPIDVRRGRPKFKILDRKMDKMGPHHLAEGFVIPEPINKFLRPYQREGVEFLFAQYRKGKGGLLGDDMGLGKTIQVIAFLSAIMRNAPQMGLFGVTGTKKDLKKRSEAIDEARRDDGVYPLPSSYGHTCLIVAPASVVHNWKREFTTWSYLDVMVYEGGKKPRAELMTRFRQGYYDVVIASFEAVRDNIESLRYEDFSLVIVDEAHRVKNPRSGTTKALHLFESRLRYGMTGTAIQNRLEELWCILDWTCPGDVGRQNLWSLYISGPLKFAQKIDADDATLAKGRERALQLVTKLLPHFWLRRTKDTVKLQLPKKTESVVICPLTPLQRSVYKKIMDLDDVQRILRYDQPCECGSMDDQGLRYQRRWCCDPLWYKNILKYITLFQKISNHLALIYPDKEDMINNEEKYHQDYEWARQAFPQDHSKRNRGTLTSFDSELCGKWDVLYELLTEWFDKGDKVLIFSLSLRVLALIKEKLENTHFTHEFLDGSVPQDQRMDRVDRFNKDPSVFCFLISTRAGGVGLNLTAANRVVIFDPNWNPSHDLQAQDRAFRFGQQRDVNVYRLIGAGTLEELIYNRQQYKRAQAQVGYEATAERRMYAGVEGEKEEQGELFGVKNIFRFNEHESLTEKAIHACNMAELEFALKNTILANPEGEDKKGKKKKSKKGDDSDSDIDEAVSEDVALQHLTGGAISKSAEEEARIKKAEAERVAIARIFEQRDITVTVDASATIGGSRAEEERARKAMQESKSKPKPLPPSAAPPKKKPRTSSTNEKPRYDPLARSSKGGGKKEEDIKPSIKKEALDEKEERALLTWASNQGIQASVPVEELVKPSGYVGPRGMMQLSEELLGLSREAHNNRIREILKKYTDTRDGV